MTPCPNVPLAALGILGFLVKRNPQAFRDSAGVAAYCAGREARIAGATRESAPAYQDEETVRDWQRGWDIVDYQLNHPEEAR
jgi:ribosome modulation factor